ncbi:unnamed protein product [Cladocopium goreaui]|uniref:von Willebrand factor A domain-containing protein 3A n=1 Tax=Cladocopium goreaui TaxID=2562237 RepID=A0A9P1D333_9DINO|nr:unnamed protein product [Cladocopium goreaui]
MELKRRSALLAIESFYYGQKRNGPGKPGNLDTQWNLLSIGRENGVQLKQPKGQVVAAVIGDPLSGKSSFLNALAEELVFPHRNKNKSSLVQWAVSEEVQKGEWPALLLRVVERFPAWEPKALATVRTCNQVMGGRLKGLQLVEVPSPTNLPQEDLEVIHYMLSKVDLVVCLMDSQAKEPLSDDMMALLTNLLAIEDAPPLHFLLAKADLISRESDRIRLIAKASRMLQERLGRGRRGFEILPVSTGDLNVLLDILELDNADEADGADVGAKQGTMGTPKWDAGRVRTWQLTQDLIAQRMKEALQAMEVDVQALKGALALQRHDPQAANNHLIWCGAAFGIVTAVVPFILDEEDASLVPVFMAATMVMACVCLLLAFFLSRGASKPAPGVADIVAEQERFLSVVEKQCEALKNDHDFPTNGEIQGEAQRNPEDRTDRERAMSSIGSPAGQKVRLNVVALVGEGIIGKFLVSIDGDALVEDLASQIRSALARAKVEGRLLRLTNTKQAQLPSEERVGDALRDSEEVLAVLVNEPEDEALRQLAPELGDALSFTRTTAPFPHLSPAEAPTQRAVDRLEALKNTRSVAPMSILSSMDNCKDKPPGPQEIFQEDLQPPANSAPGPDCKEPCFRSIRCDWEVEQLTPKLREYIAARFSEMHEMPADPGHAYIIVSMRPRERPGSVVSPLPIHYSVARVDIIEFERLCGRRVQEIRARLDFFQRCLEALRSLLERGADREDYAPNMLPYSYKPGKEFGTLLQEVDEKSFGQVEGFRPLLVIDMAGAVGKYSVFIKAAVKRLMYSFLVAKSRFNIISFSRGKVVAWEDHLVPPVAQKLREAEDFVDKLQPAKRTCILQALCWALQSDADAIYLLTSGFPKYADTDYCRAEIRSQNKRQLPIHVIGVQCEAEAEIELRRLAEENRASFRPKTFNETLSAEKCLDLVNAGRSAAPCQRLRDHQLSIGGQVDILEVMIKEQEIQTTDWLEEQKCANRILLTSASQHPVPNVQQARYAAGRMVVNQLCRNPPPPLRDLLQPQTPKSAKSRVTELFKTSQTAPKRSEKRSENVRPPSVHNPWDRPSGILKVSQVASKDKSLLPARNGQANNESHFYELAR